MENKDTFEPMTLQPPMPNTEPVEVPEEPQMEFETNNYDEEVDNAVGALTSVIEPLLMVFLAIVVGTIVIAMFLPIIDVIKNMTGG